MTLLSDVTSKLEKFRENVMGMMVFAILSETVKENLVKRVKLKLNCQFNYCWEMLNEYVHL